MIESNPSPTGQATNLQVMDVMLKWADMNISKPGTTACAENGQGGGTGAPGNGKGQGAANNNENGRF